MSNYDNFVFYGSWRETLEGFAEDFGKEYAQEALWNLMLSGTAGDMETTKKSIISWVNGSCMDNINSAKDRYSKAVENGKKGGRPVESNAKQIAELKEQGLTHKQIADELGCSTKTVQRALKQVDKTGQNLDIDIDIDNDIEREKDIALAVIDMFKAKAKYKDIQAGIKKNFGTDMSFDDIKGIIDSRDALEAEIKHNKAIAPANQAERAEYERFDEVIAALDNRGIVTTYDEVVRCYRFSMDVKHKPWTVDKMVAYINLTDKQGWTDYVNDFDVA